MTSYDIEPVTREPLNAHTPAAALAVPRTPSTAFYVRSHFPAPALDPRTWQLQIAGRAVTLAQLRAMPQRTLDVVLECAGNGRTRMSPLPPGTPWGERALGCATFGGVPLRDILRVPPDVKELVFVGADRGEKEGEQMHYARSLAAARALHPDTLIALDMDGAPLARDHGAPARLLVPGNYGMDSVKWLTEIRVSPAPFQGYFQAQDYWLRAQRDHAPDRPLGAMAVKSCVVEPGAGDTVPVGVEALVWGWAWTGSGSIQRVELSHDGGATWRTARIERPSSPYAWTRWSCGWKPPGAGPWTLLSRATDTHGQSQPVEAPWNALGYANNECGHVEVHAAEREHFD